jgi:hypothetical protein
VRRHQITNEEDSSPLTPSDLAVGRTVTIYGRTFFLVDADAFTRSWYGQHMELELAPAGSYPSDPVDAYRQHFGLNVAPSKHVQGTYAVAGSWSPGRHRGPQARAVSGTASSMLTARTCSRSMLTARTCSRSILDLNPHVCWRLPRSQEEQ